MKRKILIFAAVALLAVGLAACGSSSKKSDSPASSGSGSASITIADFSFTVGGPVKAGSTVTVKNNGPSTHTVTSDTSGQFDTSNVDSGKTVTFTAPSTAGSYPFHCNIHSFMKGTLVVT